MVHALGNKIKIQAIICPSCQRILLDEAVLHDKAPAGASPNHRCNGCGMEFLRTPNTVANPLATFYPRLVDHELRILCTTSGALSTNPTGNTNLVPRTRLGIPKVLMKIRPAQKPTPKLNLIKEAESPSYSTFDSPDKTSNEVSSCRHLGEGIQQDYPESHFGAFELEFREYSVRRANICSTAEDIAKIYQWLD